MDREFQVFFPDGIELEEVEVRFLDIYSEDWLAEISAYNPTCLLAGWSTPELPQCWLENEHCDLRYVCYVAGSVRRVVPRIFIEKGGIVSNWGALCAPMVAEHALLLALAAARNQPLWGDYMQMPFLLLRWAQLKTQTLYGRSVGIHGFGNVARSLIRLLKPFNVRISAYSDGVPPQLMRDVQVVPTTSLGELFTQSEVLFECEALTEHSENSVNAEMLARLPDGAVFVNVGRGAVVSEEALMVEAASGRLRVAVDVCESEPDYRDAAIRTSPRLILSPHIAGPTADQLPAIGRYALANLKRYLYGKSPGSLINLDIYDRST